MISNKFALVSFLSLGCATIAITGSSLPSLGRSESEESQDLVKNVWSLVNARYVDGAFVKKNWRAVGNQYVTKGRYRNRAEAYRAVRQMLTKLNDPYTQFLDPKEYAQRQASMANTITGVGMTTEDPLNQPSIVISVVEGSPAQRAGVLPEDRIVAVDGKLVRRMAAGQVTQAIRGPVGTRVVLTVQRQGQQVKIPIVREKINFPTVRYTFQADQQVGYIRLGQFGDNAAREMAAAIENLEAQQPKGYILDLRGNPGGRVDMAATIAGQWMGEAVLSTIRDRHNSCELNFPSLVENGCRIPTRGKPLTDRPLVVLVNGNSASASEMLAGAFQDQRRAVVVGDKTFGKGVVQSIFSLGNGSALTLTTDRYLTPQGRAIHKVGLQPDVKVATSANERRDLFRAQRKLGTSADRQYMKALSLLQGMQGGS
jgi:carboxyl-terminal processing protease